MLGAGNASNASVHLPGVYTCTLLTSDCPPFRSISSYTVIDAGGFFTPSLSTTGSISCTNPTTQIVASHNSALHTFSWTGPGILSSPTNSLISANAAGVYSVMITNTLSGCTMTAQIGMADGIGPLDISNSGGNLFLCTPVSPQTLTVSGAGSYTWSPNIAISSTLGAVVTITPGGSPVYTISGSLGVCSGSTVLGVYVTPSPTVTTAISNTTVCSGAPAYLSAGGNAYAYTWYPGGINGASVVVTPTATTIYTVSGNYGGCLTNAEVTVHVNPKPSITVNAVHPYVCIGMSNTFSASGAQNITWYPGGIVSNSLVVTPTFTGNTVYTVTGTSSLGCSGTWTFITVTTPGLLNITPTNPAVCANQNIMLVGTPITFNNYNWIGPTIVSSGQNTVIVSPSVTSIYTLQASSVSPYCVRTATISVTAYSLPVIGIAASSTNVCAGTQLTLTPSGAVNYSLGIPAQQTGTLFTLTPPGSTIYTIYGSDGFGCKNTNTVQIVVTATPNVSANTPNVNLCPRDTAVIVASGANSYTWHPGALTGNTVQVSPLSTTIYTVSGSIGNCVRSTTLLLNAVQSPTVNLTSSNAGVCPGNSITILANGASSYTWLPGNTNGSGLTLVGTATASGQYSVFGTNAYNCRDTAYVNFYIIPNPTVVIVAQPTVLCVGDTCLMLANGATNYTWQPGNHVGTSYTVNPSTNTNYTIAGTNGSCTTSSSIAIQVNPYPNLGVVSNPSIVCSGGQSTLTAFGASSYSWVSMAQTSQSIVVVPTGTSIYSVIGTSQACSSTQTVLVQVYTNSLQVVSPSVICRGESATLTASGALTYTWSSVNNSPQLVVYPIADTILVLSSTDANNCQTQVTITILVSECVSLGELDEARQIRIYPNPNQGDFTLLWEQQQAGTRLRIFNNLGQLVLEEPVIFTSQKINFNRFDKGLYTLDLILVERVIFRTKLVKE